MFNGSLFGAHALDLAKGNMGAKQVLNDLVGGGIDDELNKLERHNITGSKVWVIYKEQCKGNMEAFREYVNKL